MFCARFQRDRDWRGESSGASAEARGGMKAKAGTPQSPVFAMQSQKVALNKMGSIVPESMLTLCIEKIFASLPPDCMFGENEVYNIRWL